MGGKSGDSFTPMCELSAFSSCVAFTELAKLIFLVEENKILLLGDWRGDKGRDFFVHIYLGRLQS